MEDATALALRSTSSTSASGLERMVIAPRAEKSREEVSTVQKNRWNQLHLLLLL
jgi:hypothetical protein